MVDGEDDRKMGLRTSAITFGRHDVNAVIACHALFLLIMLWIGRLLPGWLFYLGLAVAAGLVAVPYRMIPNRNPAGWFCSFWHNNWMGVGIFAGIFPSFFFQPIVLW